MTLNYITFKKFVKGEQITVCSDNEVLFSNQNIKYALLHQLCMQKYNTKDFNGY